MDPVVQLDNCAKCLGFFFVIKWQPLYLCIRVISRVNAKRTSWSVEGSLPILPDETLHRGLMITFSGSALTRFVEGAAPPPRQCRNDSHVCVFFDGSPSQQLIQARHLARANTQQLITQEFSAGRRVHHHSRSS